MKPSRRRFLETGALAGAALGLGRTALGAPRVAAAQAPPAPSWVDRPMRWAQLTLVEDDPGEFDLPFWLDYFRRTQHATRSASAPAAASPTTPPRSRSTTAAGSWATATSFGELVAGCRKLGMVVIARTDPHATYDDVRRPRIPTGSPSTPTASPRRHWASPEMWVTCGLGPYNFEFMTEVTKEIVTRYKVDGIFINRWAGSGMCYCEHCRTNFRAATGHELPRHGRPAGPGAAGDTSSGEQQRALRALAALGRGGPQDQPRLVRDPERRRRRDQLARHEGASASSPRRCSPTARRGAGCMPPWANGKNAKEYRATLGDKPVGGHLQRGRGGGVPLEGLGAERGGDPPLGGRRGRQRPAALVHQVRRRAPRPPLARSRSRTSTAGTTAPSATCATSSRSPASAWSTRSRPPGSTAASAPRERVEDHALGLVPGARSRPASPSRWSTTGSSTPTTWRAFQTLILPNIAALSDEQCRQLARVRRARRAVSSRRTRRRSTTSGACRARRLRPGGPLRRLLRAPDADGPMRNAYLRLEHDPHRPAASAPRGPRGRAADHPRRLAARRQADRARSRARR